MMQFGRGDSPCMHCPDKRCGVYHNLCPEFLKWRKALDERNEAERKYHKSNDTMSDAKRKANWRSKRYSRQSQKAFNKEEKTHE